MGHLTLVFGDSNVLTFRNLHLEPGCEHWQPHPENPKEDFPVVPPGTVVPMKWTSVEPSGGSVEAYAQISATAGGLGRMASTGGEIRRVLRERAEETTRVVFFFGQMDLDFLLWYVLGRKHIEPAEFVRQRAEDYLRFIHDDAMPPGPVSVLEIHPITVADPYLEGFLRRYRIELPRFPHSSPAELLRVCPWFQRQRRAGLRRLFAEHARRLCEGYGYDYLENPAGLAEDYAVMPRYACHDPFEPHVSFPHVLPLWLDKLAWLRRSVAASS
jgi:hypothetical protein